jgi:hypothetical protein
MDTTAGQAHISEILTRCMPKSLQFSRRLDIQTQEAGIRLQVGGGANRVPNVMRLSFSSFADHSHYL